MNLRVIKNCTIQGKKYSVGETADVDIKLASTLSEYLSADMAPAENRSIGLAESPEVPMTRKRKTKRNGD